MSPSKLGNKCILTFLLADCFLTPQKIFIIFCKTRVQSQNTILVIPYNNVFGIVKVKFYYAFGMYKRNQRFEFDSWIFSASHFSVEELLLYPRRPRPRRRQRPHAKC